MAHYYIYNGVERGYIVAQMEEDGEGYFSCSFVCNFGYRQSDAFVFRDDCNKGKIDPRKIQYLIKTYTDTPYKYFGGVLRKQ